MLSIIIIGRSNGCVFHHNSCSRSFAHQPNPNEVCASECGDCAWDLRSFPLLAFRDIQTVNVFCVCLFAQSIEWPGFRSARFACIRSSSKQLALFPPLLAEIDNRSLWTGTNTESKSKQNNWCICQLCAGRRPFTPRPTCETRLMWTVHALILPLLIFFSFLSVFSLPNWFHAPEQINCIILPTILIICNDSHWMARRKSRHKTHGMRGKMTQHHNGHCGRQCVQFHDRLKERLPIWIAM